MSLEYAFLINSCNRVLLLRLFLIFKLVKTVNSLQISFGTIKRFQGKWLCFYILGMDSSVDDLYYSLYSSSVTIPEIVKESPTR